MSRGRGYWEMRTRKEWGFSVPKRGRFALNAGAHQAPRRPWSRKIWTKPWW